MQCSGVGQYVFEHGGTRYSGAERGKDALQGVCSIFLRADRSINEIHYLRALFSIKVFYKKYVLIIY
jgi:hypothetical protein